MAKPKPKTQTHIIRHLLDVAEVRPGHRHSAPAPTIGEDSVCQLVARNCSIRQWWIADGLVHFVADDAPARVVLLEYLP